MPETFVHRRGELLEAEIDGELVALHVENGTCYGFNGTATRIWSLIEVPRRVSELAEVLAQEYAVDHATCEADVVALLAELEADGLVALTRTVA